MTPTPSIDDERRHFDWRRKALVWIFEVLFEAIATCAVLIALAFITREPHERNDLTFRMLGGVTLIVLFYFAFTGYLVTSCLAAMRFRFSSYCPYPLIVAMLYFIHSSIFFLLAGNHFFNKQNLTIQLSGAVTASLIAQTGNRMLTWRIGRGEPLTG